MKPTPRSSLEGFMNEAQVLPSDLQWKCRTTSACQFINISGIRSHTSSDPSHGGAATYIRLHDTPIMLSSCWFVPFHTCSSIMTRIVP